LLIFTLSALYTIPVKAQEKKDSLVVVSVFTGNEKNLTDSLLAYGKGATDPEFKAVLVDAAAVIKATPTDGKIDSWYAWIVAVLAAIFGVYQYIKAKTAPPKAKQKE